MRSMPQNTQKNRKWNVYLKNLQCITNTICTRKLTLFCFLASASLPKITICKSQRVLNTDECCRSIISPLVMRYVACYRVIFHILFCSLSEVPLNFQLDTQNCFSYAFEYGICILLVIIFLLIQLLRILSPNSFSCYFLYINHIEIKWLYSKSL